MQQLSINPAQYELLNILSCIDKEEDFLHFLSFSDLKVQSVASQSAGPEIKLFFPHVLSNTQGGL